MPHKVFPFDATLGRGAGYSSTSSYVEWYFDALWNEWVMKENKTPPFRKKRDKGEATSDAS
jgi:hypothetical protein